MKHRFSLIIAMLFGVITMQARPVDVETAKNAGRNFLGVRLETQRQNIDLQLVYTGVSDRGEPCFYVFNSGRDGFVAVSADDRFRPIVGYSVEGPFETENMSPELKYYLGTIIEARTSRNAVLPVEAAAEWQAVLGSGKLPSRNGGKAATYICETKWNQDTPYNLYSPAAAGGPDDRCYAGCVATAMSQVMKHWNKPLQGTGSHSYNLYGYGTLSADFGATTYDWDNMPNHIVSGSPQEEIEAVALLMHHCAVAVDMMFSPTGSGAYSHDVPYAISQYFSYSNHASFELRSDYSLLAWQNKLKESFDRNWPLYYSGYSSSGGHAFVCDGYDDNDLFHFNWGWGGSSDGWFVIDEIDYSNGAAAIFNFVPTEVFLYMPYEPTNFTATSLGDAEFSASLTWTNPTHNIQNQALTNIDQIVVTRNGKTIFTEANATPGATMTFTDKYLPTSVDYKVFAIVNSAKGLEAEVNDVILGPSTTWTVEGTSSDTEGWYDATISFVNSAGIEIASVGMGTTAMTQNVEMPVGNVYLYWNRPSQEVENLTFNIKNDAGETVVAFEGSSNQLDRGLFFIANTSSGAKDTGSTPSNLTATIEGNNVKLAWDVVSSPIFTYCIYRDGLMYDISNTSQYTDTDAADQFHSYYITSLDEIGESNRSNICNISKEGDCTAPANFFLEKMTSNKVRLQWEAPEAESVTGYTIYRRARGEDFATLKLLTNTSYNYTLNTLTNDRYDLVVSAFYSSTNCESNFANAANQPELLFITLNKTIIPYDLTCTQSGNSVILHWAEALKADSYNIYRDDELLAEGITETTFADTLTDPEKEYCYRVTGKTEHIESSPTNEVCAKSLTNTPETTEIQNVEIYPNPTSGMVYLKAETIVHVSVINPMGQVVAQQSLNNEQALVNLSSLPDGTYFIKAVTASGTLTKKIVKMQ